VKPLRLAFVNRNKRAFNAQTVLHEPLGGTQSAMVYLARELAALGHEPHIFCHCGELAGVFDGVSYHPVAALLPFSRQQPLDYLIAVAEEALLKLGIRARHTLWWSHNDYSYVWQDSPDLRAELAATLAQRADKLITVSQWQADRLAEAFHLPPEHFFVSRNGVHWPYFAAEPQPLSPPRLFYTSVPDRGLDILLEIFPRIRAAVPETELHIYGGFEVWGAGVDADHSLAARLKAQGASLPGVSFHAPVTHGELAQRLLTGSLLVYPNHLAETSCIAALEAQAAGLPVITSVRGGLPETVSHEQSGLLIPGDPYSAEYQAAFVAATVSLLRQPDLRQGMAQAARARIQKQFTWQVIAQEWSEQLMTLVSSRQSRAPLTSAFAKPQISVIVSTANRPEALELCLAALAAQDFPAFEVLVADTGQTPQTQSVSERFRQQLNLRYCQQSEPGFQPAKARNLGIFYSRARLLVLLDGDLVIPPSFLTLHALQHQRHPKVVVSSYIADRPAELGWPTSVQEVLDTEPAALTPDPRQRQTAFDTDRPLTQPGLFRAAACSFRRELLSQAGGFDPAFVGWGHEDTEFGLRLAPYVQGLLLSKAGSSAIHLGHAPASEAPEAERQANWQRLQRRHGRQNFAHALWSIPVSLPVLCLGTEHMPGLIEGYCQLETGQHLPASGLVTLQISAGLVTHISC